MSVPTIVVSPTAIPSSFQIATPFSYTFSNSGPYNPDTPTYTGTGVTFSNTSPYTPENTLVSAISNSQTIISTVVGTAAYPLYNVSNGSIFEFTFPYPTSGINGGTMWFGSNAKVNFSGGAGIHNVQYNSLGSYYAYSSNDSLRCTFNTGNTFAVELILSGIPTSLGNVSVSIIQFTLCNVTWPTPTPSDPLVSFAVKAVDPIINGRITYPYLNVTSLTSAEFLPFVSGSGTTQVTLASAYGFQGFPSSNLTFRIDQTYNGTTIGSNVTSNITISNISIEVAPTLANPLSLVTYQPFSYAFSIPSDVVNVYLQPNSTTSSGLLPYIAGDGSSFSSESGLTSSGITKLEIDAVLNGNTILASNVTNIVTTGTGVTVTPSILSGSLNLYKYEPFSYVFTSNPLSQNLTLQFTNSSSELQAFCSLSSDGQTVTFAGTFAASYSATLSLFIDSVFDGSVVATTTILIAVGAGRFFPPISNQNYQLYQYENISNTFGSNIVFSTVTPIDTIFTTPALPSGLSFGTVTLGNNFYLQGMPVLQSAQNTYKVIGSNSSNGKIVTTTVSMKVNPQIVRVTPSLVTLSGLTVGTAIDPVTFTSIQPTTIYANTFRYTWSGLPDGFSFQFQNGSNFPDGGTPTDPALSIVLVGSPSLAFAYSMSTSGGNLYQTRLTGYQTDQTGKQTTGTALLNFSFGETVLISVSNTVPLYQTKPLGSNDVVITAGSFFPTSEIASITSSNIPAGLNLVQYGSSNVYHLVGTPTAVDTTSFYTFTALNYNSLSRSTTVQIPVYPDIVTFVSPSPADGSSIQLIVSRPILSDYPSSIVFQATSTSSATPIVYSSSLDLSIYGLSLNSSTGVVGGLPTTSLSLTSVTITATDTLGTIGTTTIQLTILADVFTWPTYTPTYIQNRPIDPYTIVVTSTLSERSIQSYSSADLPVGLFINPSGTISGAPSVFPSGGTGTFHITATTGYSTLSHEYSYTMIQDLLLTLEIGGATPVQSTVFSNVLFETIQYATNTLVQPTYSIIDLSPSQWLPLPVINISSNGVMTADFTNVVGSNYTATINATYGTATGTTPISFSFTPITFPIVTAAYWKPYNSLAPSEVSTTGGYIASANTYVFPGPIDQSWNNKQPISPYYNGGSQQYYVTKPEISRIGEYYVASGTGSNGVLIGWFPNIYNSNSLVYSNIEWFIDNSLEPTTASYPAIANNSVDTWVVLSLSNIQPQSNRTGVWTRTGFSTGAWSLVRRITTTVPTLTYFAPFFVLGNSGLGATVDINGCNIGTYSCNANRVQWASESDLGTWTTSDTLPGFSNILRFASSNTTLVAIGSGAPTGVFPLAYATDPKIWTNATSPSILTGGNVVLNDLLYANNTWVLCGLNSNSASFLAYSSDLSNWSFYTKPDIISNAISWDAIGFNRNAWTIAGSSTNGSTSSVSCILSVDAGAWPTQSYSLASGTLFSNSNAAYVPITRVSRIVSDVQQIGGSTGIVSIPNAGSLTFSKPPVSSFTLFQYVPYSIPVQAIGTSDFIYYYVRNVPTGFSFIPDSTGVAATLSVISPSNTSQVVTIYANTVSGYLTSTSISFNTILPFFVNPQSGAGAYTALLRNEVEANASQNARDNTVFPQEDPLAGPYMGPRAPDVVTPDDCFLKLCKKPCPTCHSM